MGVSVGSSIYNSASIYESGAGGGGGGGELPEGFKRLYFIKDSGSGVGSLNINVSNFDKEINGKCSFGFPIRIPAVNTNFQRILQINPTNVSQYKYISLLLSTNNYRLEFFSNSGNYPFSNCNYSAYDVLANCDLNADTPNINGVNFSLPWNDPPIYKDAVVDNIEISAGSIPNIEFYGLQIKDEDKNLIYDFVPCKNTDTNEIGFFEMKQELFFKANGCIEGPPF